MAFSTIQGSGGAPDSFVGTSGVDSITLIDSLGNFDLVAKGADDVVTILAAGYVVTSDASARGGDGSDTFQTLGTASQVFNNSFFNGNAGNDFLDFSGDTLADTSLLGGKGDDIIATGAAISSRFNGNIGDDTLTIDGISSYSSFYGGQDDDTINIDADVTNSLISGDDGNDAIVIDTVSVLPVYSVAGSTLSGGNGDDIINATKAISSVLIDGGDGIDALTGSGLADTLLGGDGTDTITGNAGADSMTGGAGIDAFSTGLTGGVAATAAVANVSMTFANGVDVITDFATTSETLANSTTAFVFTADAVRGNFVEATGVFTASGTGADTLVATGLVADFIAASAVLSTDNATVLLGTGATLIAANLI